MGYCTTFNLTWKRLASHPTVERCDHKKPAGANYCPVCGKPASPVTLDEAIREALAKAKEENDGEKLYGISEDGESTGSCKWYDYQEEIAEFSKQFPEVLFTLEGEGEESGDIWRRYFVNGKMQLAKAKITFDEFDEKELRIVP